MVDRDVFERCLNELMKRRGVHSHFETAFDATDILMLLDDAAFLTEQPDAPE